MEKQETDNDSTSVLEKTKEIAAHSSTMLWDELPEWLQDNHFIHSGYRPPSNSYRKSIASLGYLHNESVNVWTHLSGAVVAMVTAGVLYNSIKPRFEMATAEDVTVFACFFLGATGCLSLSAAYHLLSNHSEAVAKFGNRLDYIGIVVLIWGSFVPSIYYGFGSDPAVMKTYWTMVTTVGAGTLVVVLYPKFRTPSWRPFRAFMFMSMGLSAVIPVIHGLQLYGTRQMERQIGLWWLIGQGILYVLGALIYAMRIPERWKPGAFDIWGSSHQIFHVLVLMAAAAHFTGLVKAFDYEHRYRVAVMSSYNSARRLGSF